MKTPIIISAAGLVLMTACADRGANYQPILDGAPTPSYQADLAACQALARNQNQFDQETLGAAVLGAGAGAALGEADDGDALGGAIAGGLAGGVAGAVNASERRDAIVVECLRGRGHRVVG
ncbi:glycine zipper family protein [Marivita sp.]|uniref:glycine zipper family protein n=1 Tax=Marivita sp. TaxID=2003365 RepID=UPI003F6B351A